MALNEKLLDISALEDITESFKCKDLLSQGFSQLKVSSGMTPMQSVDNAAHRLNLCAALL